MASQPITAKNILRKLDLTSTELAILKGATVTASELNILDGVTATTAELNKTDGLASTTNELDEFVIGQANISDISGTNGITLTSPYAGELVLAISRVSGDPGAETDLAVVVDGGTSAGDITIANGASADEVDTLAVTTNNTLSVGSKIVVTSDGAATSAVSADVVLVGRRT